MPQRHCLRRADLPHFNRGDMFFTNHFLFSSQALYNLPALSRH
jgi:hypothetical protein